MPKRIRIDESQYDKFLKRFEDKRDDHKEVPKEGTAQAISNMRHQTAEINHSLLRMMAHKFIDKAFKLGCEYTDKAVDQEAQMNILKRLEHLNKIIDSMT